MSSRKIMPTTSALLRVFSSLIFFLFATLTSAAPVSPIAIAEPTNARYPGTLKLDVDVTDVERKIHKARLQIPVAAGPLTLLFPQWLPGNHAPNGVISGLSGLTIKANGQALAWTRDTIQVFAFHLTAPAGVSTIEAEYEYLTAVSPAQGRVLVTPDIVNVQWNSVVLYPAGYNADGVMVEATMTHPEGWQYATALEAKKTVGNKSNKVEFAAVSLTDLVDSPVYIGRFVKSFELDPGSKIPVRFNFFADNAESLEAKPEQIDAHRKMVRQTYKVFGAGPYSRYEFLIAASEVFGGTGGLEHRQSTEIGVGAGYFTKYKDSAPMRGVVPHEFVHSWDGKFRRPADLNTRNFNEPMQNSLLWVYEGQTTYWTDIISARSGLHSPLEAREALARTAAFMQQRAGRTWRNLQDTTNDPIMSSRGRDKSWSSWQRGSDYYPEALLIWLDADFKIRELTQEKKSLDDFARAFFAVPANNFATKTYTFDDVTAALNAVAPHDWKTFLRTRLDSLRDNNPLDTLGRSGWKLVYTDKPNVFGEAANKNRGTADFVHSLGLSVDKKDVISDVEWASPAFTARITVGATLLAVNGRAYKADLLNNAITAAKASKKPIELLIKSDDTYRTVSINYFEGIRHPHLERVEGTKDRLSAVFAPLS
jgi:predicted metalloprotease with PDZ domain